MAKYAVTHRGIHIAPLKDETGSYHIDSSGKPMYTDRFSRTFGYYCNRAAVMHGDKWYHISVKGERAYDQCYSWTGNFQENLCPVRDTKNNYFHIDLSGNRIYNGSFIYCGDYKDEIACVKTTNDFYRHIDTKGNFINDTSFLDLDVFHKNFAKAKDQVGWHHIDKLGRELYKKRYSAIEPFYNGFALVTRFNNQKIVIDEKGNEIIEV